MEIDITAFYNATNPFDFSASVAERGPNAARDTWAAALKHRPHMLTTPEQREAFRRYLKSMGFSEPSESIPEEELQALFVQEVSNAMRERNYDGDTGLIFQWYVDDDKIYFDLE